MARNLFQWNKGYDTRHPSWKTGIIGLFVTLKTDPMIILLCPMFFDSNWVYTWHQCPPSFSGSI
ncbi:hypothetical protein EV421DRAFT_1815351 [Armillaria borealis]|uniref:Uncharacterized protein n=1 Tax=Armillaria borealis TaxID=47425 RepID=A0AA39MNI6_9AGAR|nr:hypothetical protein EV421DRAFT_1815351 [Armillaria borealis]